MPKSDVFSIRLSQREQWLISWLEPEYAGQPLSQRIRNLLVDAAAHELKVDVTRDHRGDRTIHLPTRRMGLKRGEEPTPRRWPVT